MVFARHFKQDALADVDLTIYSYGSNNEVLHASKRARHSTSQAESAPALLAAAFTQGHQGSADDDEQHVQLVTLPAHKIILFESEYFEAQAQHWQPEPSTAPALNASKKRRSSSSSSSRSSASAPGSRPVLHLTIESAEHLPAAEAVVAAMYGVPVAKCSLDHEQLVYAVLIADMVHVEAAAQQAARLLMIAAQSGHGLSAAALEALADVAWPACLLQLLPVVVKHSPCCRDQTAGLAAITAADSNGRVQQLLLAVLGDLEEVWADRQLKALMLELPLPAMQLLLSSDQLCVASEDTVLYTAQQYVTTNRKKKSVPYDVLRGALAPLVRAPHLSLFPLSCVAVPPNSRSLLMGAYHQQLQSLLCLKHMAGSQQLAAGLGSIPNIPDSWQLGLRQITPLPRGVWLEWLAEVQEIKAMCRDSFAEQQTFNLTCIGGSPPLTGRAWAPVVQCSSSDAGTQVQLLVGPKNVPPNVFVKSYKYTISCCGKAYTRSVACAGPRQDKYHCFSCSEAVFPAERMPGGWCDAAWAAAGLPSSGYLRLRLHMHSAE